MSERELNFARALIGAVFKNLEFEEQAFVRKLMRAGLVLLDAGRVLPREKLLWAK